MPDGNLTQPPDGPVRADRPQQSITCRLCGFENPVGGDACANCDAEFSEGVPEAPSTFEGRMLGMHLGDLATGPVLWLDAGTDALDAVTRMKAAGTDYVLVGLDGRLEGIFTDRDAMLKLAGISGPTPRLGDVMSRHPEVLRAEDTVATAIHKMAVGTLRHLPLHDDDGSITVVTARDIFRHLAARLG